MSTHMVRSLARRATSLVVAAGLFVASFQPQGLVHAQSIAPGDVGASVYLVKMKADETTENTDFLIGSNDRDEVYIISSATKFGADKQRIGNPVGDRLPGRGDYYEFKNGWDSSIRGWTNQDQKSQGRPMLWSGVIPNGQSIFVVANIGEQDNDDLDDIARAVAGGVGLVGTVITAIFTGPGVVAGVGLFTTAINAGSKLIKNNGDDAIGGIGVKITNNGGNLTYEWGNGSTSPTSGEIVLRGDKRSKYRVSAAVSIRKFSPLFGGGGGSDFMITSFIPGLKIRHGEYVNAVQLMLIIWFLGGQKAGGNGGSESQISLNWQNGERIVAVRGAAGDYVDSITLITNHARQFGPYGGSGGQPFEFVVPDGYRFVGFYGRAGQLIDAIGVVYELQS